MSNFEEAILFYKSAKFLETQKICENLLKKDPNNFELLNLIGATFLQLKLYSEAEISIKKSIQINPNHHALYNNLGVIYKEKKIFKDAIENFNKAIELKPNYLGAYNNLGIVLTKVRNYKEAFFIYNKCLELDQRYPDTYNNLGILNLEIKNFDKALINFNKAIEINYKYVEAHENIANTYALSKKYSLAINYFEKLKKINNSKKFYYEINILFNQIKTCDWKNFEKIIKKIKKNILNQTITIPPLKLLYLIDEPKIIKDYIQNLDIENKFQKKNSFGINKKPNKKIILGYYSSDFREHAVSHLLTKILESHNKEEFEIIGFNFSKNPDDKYTKEIKKNFDKFLDVRTLSDEDIVILTKQLKVDLAIDLNGHTLNGRPDIFRRRAAPIQINYLGYPGTIGNYIDYIIADKTIIPEEDKKFYFEKIIYLPDTYQPYNPNQTIKLKNFNREKFNLPNSKFIYCCLNKMEKINPKIFNSWLKILKKTENTLLLLLNENLEAKNNLLKIISENKIDSSRIIFSPFTSYREHLERFHYCDIFLDTYPYSGHTTASEALSNGLPLLTMKGKSFQSRVSSSLLHNLGLDELIMENMADYEKFAIEIAQSSEKITKIKKKLILSMQSSNIFNAKIYTKNLEKAYKQVYERHKNSLIPEDTYIN
jgi:predicted O-linked N-acetylglucosamine transferase (SPINDLY family)